MRKIKRVNNFLPPWDMPSDPVKAVFWFFYWLLKVIVRLFWIPILGMIIFEVYLNWKAGGVWGGLVSGVATLLVGLAVWGVLFAILSFLNMTVGVSRIFSQVHDLRQEALRQRPVYPFGEYESEDHIVEGTITDLEEERRKRKRESF